MVFRFLLEFRLQPFIFFFDIIGQQQRVFLLIRRQFSVYVEGKIMTRNRVILFVCIQSACPPRPSVRLDRPSGASSSVWKRVRTQSKERRETEHTENVNRKKSHALLVKRNSLSFLSSIVKRKCDEILFIRSTDNEQELPKTSLFFVSITWKTKKIFFLLRCGRFFCLH